MRLIELRDAFGIENLHIGERKTPAPRRGEVLLKMRAASLNYRDLLMVLGHYNPKQLLPLIPCSDGVGEIVEVGAGVSGLRSGERVMPLFVQGWLAGSMRTEHLASTLGGPLDGVLAEQMVVPAQSVVRVPSHLSDVEAATLPCAALTAWSALVTHGELRPGQTVLLLGTGGVSIFALQFAKLLGARVIITTSSEAKAKRAQALGADHVIHYPSEAHWGKAAAKWAGGGVDQVIEVGGAGTFAESLSALKAGGQMSLIGVLAGVRAELDLLPILMRGIRVQGLLVGHRQGFEAMNAAIAQHQLRPVVDRVFAMDDAPAAWSHLESAAHFGKIVLRIAAED